MRRPIEQAERIAEIETLNGPNVLSRGAPRLGAQRDQQPADRQPDPGCPGPDPDRPVGSLPLDHSAAGREGRFRRRGRRIAALTSKGAESEKIVAGDHSSQESPEVTAEIRRILLEHLATRADRGDGRRGYSIALASKRRDRRPRHASLGATVNYLTVPTCRPAAAWLRCRYLLDK